MHGGARSDRFGVSGNKMMMLKEYEVLYVERAENTVYICRRPNESGLYRVIETADRARIAKYIKYFVSCKPKEFCGDFCLNEKYYAVFRAPDGILLKNSGETLTAKKVVRALAMQDPPSEIAVNILSRDHIFVCGDEHEFAYELPETDMKITREYFFAKLAEFLDSSCDIGEDRNTEKWLADLRGGSFKDLLTAYKSMPDTVGETRPPDAKRFKKIKAALPKIAVVIATAAAIITAAVFTLAKSGEEPEYDRINSLGTIDLSKQ